MLSRTLSLLFFAFIAFATPAVATNQGVTTTVTVTAPATTATIPASQCSTGDLQCCNALKRADSSVVGVLLGLLGVVLQGVEALVGITCSPIDILGIGQGAQCEAQPVCCENNNFNGIIAIGCVPITISL